MYGFEEILVEELKAIGAEDIQLLTRAVRYRGDKEVLYKSNLLLRTALRVLKPINTFRAFREKQLYDGIYAMNWDDLLSVDKTFAIDATCSGEIFTHSKYIALKTKDAIVDQFREKYSVRPSIDTENPDLKISIHIQDTQVSVALDSSGESLGRRGYRKVQTVAPMSEVLAAGVILLSGWDKKSNFFDPMCGSGTLSIEAALMGKNIAPGSFRNFAFEKWTDFDANLWESLKADAKDKERRFEGKIFTSDIDTVALDISIQNAKTAGIFDQLEFDKMNFLDSELDEEPGTLFFNPPYGERLEDPDDIIPFYKEMGTHLKHKYNGCDAWIISGNIYALKFIGLKASRKIKLFNGPIECRLQKFELYRGSKKAAKQEE